MADFNQAAQKVLRLEGGYQNNPADAGNYNAYDSQGRKSKWRQHFNNLRAGTNHGISAWTYSSVLGREVSAAEMKALPRQTALDIYDRLYWDKIKGDQINNQAIAELTFDSIVNQGGNGVKMVQSTLNFLGNDLAVDGVVGPITLRALNQAPVGGFLGKLLEIRAEAYKRLASRLPENKVFLRGWLNRLRDWAETYKHLIPTNAGAGMSRLLFGGIAIYILYKMAK
ncbi:MAG: glycosyl hydrolase 108 family protein [Bacteroidota bacterium]